MTPCYSSLQEGKVVQFNAMADDVSGRQRWRSSRQASNKKTHPRSDSSRKSLLFTAEVFLEGCMIGFCVFEGSVRSFRESGKVQGS